MSSSKHDPTSPDEIRRRCEAAFAELKLIADPALFDHLHTAMLLGENRFLIQCLRDCDPCDPVIAEILAQLFELRETMIVSMLARVREMTKKRTDSEVSH